MQVDLTGLWAGTAGGNPLYLTIDSHSGSSVAATAEFRTDAGWDQASLSGSFDAGSGALSLSGGGARMNGTVRGQSASGKVDWGDGNSVSWSANHE